MASPSSTSQSVTVSDSAGDTAQLALEPGSLSGFSSTASGGATFGSAVVTPGAAELAAQQAAGNTAGIACQAGSSGSVVVSLTTALGLTGSASLTVGAQQVQASTSPGSGAVTVTNNVGFVSTVTPDPSAGGSTAFVRQCSNNKAEFYGVGVIRDAQSSGEQNAAVLCVVPIPFSLLGTNIVHCHVDITIVCKCTVSGAGSPTAGAYFIQKGYTDWVNNNGTITSANLSLTAQGTPSFVTNPVYTVTEERGSVIEAGGDYFYQIGPVTGFVQASSSTAITISLTELFDPFFYGPVFGTTVCEIFATAYYN